MAWVRSPHDLPERASRVPALVLRAAPRAETPATNRSSVDRHRPAPRPIRQADCRRSRPIRGPWRARGRTTGSRHPAPCLAPPHDSALQSFALLSTLLLLPAMSTDEWNESDRRHLAFLDPDATPPVHHQLLDVTVADRDEQAATVGELVEQRLRHRRRPGADENRVEGSAFFPSVGSIADEQRDVLQTERVQTNARWLVQ